MCHLLFSPKGETIPYKYLLNAQDCNKDGAGLAIADGKNIIIEKDVNMTAYQLAAKLDTWKGHPVMVHFRFGTHGSIVNDNVHPFSLPKKWAAGHNGVIFNTKCEGDESDTRAFLREQVRPIIKRGHCLTNEKIVDYLSNTVGKHNKLVFLHASGKFSIANEESGHWNKGIWHSNHDYLDWSPRFPRGYTPSEMIPYNVNELSCKACGCLITDGFYVDKDDGTVSCEVCETIAEYY